MANTRRPDFGSHVGLQSPPMMLGAESLMPGSAAGHAAGPGPISVQPRHRGNERTNQGVFIGCGAGVRTDWGSPVIPGSLGGQHRISRLAEEAMGANSPRTFRADSFTRRPFVA